MTAVSAAAKRQRPDPSTYSEAELIARAKAGDEDAIRIIVQRNNQRLFRTARAIVGNDAEAEDVVQATYVQAFINLAAFRGSSSLSTWLTRIALNEAFARVQRRRDFTGLEEIDMQNKASGGGLLHFPSSLAPADPEAELARNQTRRLLEHAVDALPAEFRTVFILRDVEGFSTEETAFLLNIKPETTKTRLHRARKMMRLSIEKQFSGAFSALFPFDGARCADMADRVITALRTIHAGKRDSSIPSQ
ncbi:MULTISPECIES: RNA polymerase sigma factor [unclassified Rhizobium]|uniref:RNA polymerase sigma factor n=1 Tax=unclassified Rhizobium TaxID=2613769 RepID=UPI000CDF50B9|nr:MULTISPECIES: RNA polymerase sigma factor [unclassified Rhizobium]AVA25200.1 RNA polymerase sigma factor protein [Rhizobium sp. NXC24]MDK4740216.1 RNA polymerase sigma factor [Rhizobium sp. CNPSo 3464]